MLTAKPCPKCGNLCDYKALTPNIVYGYYCNKCNKYFEVVRICIGWG